MWTPGKAMECASPPVLLGRMALSSKLTSRSESQLARPRGRIFIHATPGSSSTPRHPCLRANLISSNRIPASSLRSTASRPYPYLSLSLSLSLFLSTDVLLFELYSQFFPKRKFRPVAAERRPTIIETRLDSLGMSQSK